MPTYPSASLRTSTVDEILTAFSRFDEGYRREHVDAALAMRAELVPRFIALLEDMRRHPERFLQEDDFFGHLYAVMLLSHWGETAAHSAIVDLFRLPEKQIDAFFGEFIPEDLPMVLYRTSGNALDQIKSLALDVDAYSHCRSAALRALGYALADGVAARAEVMEAYRMALQPEAAGTDDSFLELAAGDALSLRAVELRETIQQAYADGRLEDSLFFSLNAFEDSLRDTEETALQYVREEMERCRSDNFHDLMGSWFMFEPEPAPNPPPPAPPKLTRQQRRRLEREQRKVQIKMQKKRRRAGRRP